MATIRQRNNIWQVQVRRNGCRPVSKSFIRKSDAVLWARTMEVKADQNELPKNDSKLLSSYTVGDLLIRYRDEILPDKRSRDSEQYHIKKIMSYYLVAIKLSELTLHDLNKFRDDRLKSVKPASVVREMAIIRHCFSVAKEDWNIPLKTNPFNGFKKPVVKNSRQRRLEQNEYALIISVISSRTHKDFKSIIDIAIETGMRRGEILVIKKQDIDFDKRLLFIPITKNGYSRTIPLSSKAMNVLRQYQDMDSEQSIFRMNSNAFRLAWERTLKRAGITGLCFHDLRHEAVSSFFEKGLAVPEVALISGHRDYRMLMRYTHIKPENLVSKIG